MADRTKSKSKAKSKPKPKPKPKLDPNAPVKRRAGPAPHTLAIDIGGTGLKALVLDARGTPLTERVRVPTPKPATPRAVLRDLAKLIARLGKVDRVSIGFPGVVVDGVTKSGPNLHPTWRGFALANAVAKLAGAPAHAINDAGMQGYGVIEGRGVEMVLTLGTGLGCALFLDGRYVPNLELAHHPYRNDKTYEDYLGAKALAKVGKKKWNKHVARAVAQIDPIWNPRRIYLGGGNSKYLKQKFPRHVEITTNIAGLLGGIALWRHVTETVTAKRPGNVRRPP